MHTLQWGLLAAIPLVLNMLAYQQDHKRFVDAVGLSALVAIFGGLTNVLDASMSFPDNKSFHPALDLFGGAITMYAWWGKRERWKLVLVGLFLTRAVLDTAFWLTWAQRPAESVGYFYEHWLFVLSLVQMVVLGGMGGWVVARDLLARLSVFLGLGHHVHSGPSASA
jgi:hypothetical protein